MSLSQSDSRQVRPVKDLQEGVYLSIRLNSTPSEMRVNWKRFMYSPRYRSLAIEERRLGLRQEEAPYQGQVSN
jgi:hypothetical protein